MTGTYGSLVDLYRTMATIRAVEQVQNDLWHRGLISGEMHSGIGEEGIVAGVVRHLHVGDAIACDHRPTGPFVARGVDPAALFLEMLGSEEGLNGGRAGHMHFMDAGRLLAADGIVGSAGPAACGFALSAEHLRPGSVAVAFFGEGALNQGMLMESFNLAAVWNLPVLFVCKDNRWSITTRSSGVTAGDPRSRADAFGLRTKRVRGSDVVAVSRVAGHLIDVVRSRRQPAFLHARCRRPDGHFLGDPVLRVVGDPVGQARDLGLPLADAARRAEGAPARHRAGAALGLSRRVATAARDHHRRHRWDPVATTRRKLDIAVVDGVDVSVRLEVSEAVSHALAVAGVGE